MLSQAWEDLVLNYQLKEEYFEVLSFDGVVYKSLINVHYSSSSDFIFIVVSLISTFLDKKWRYTLNPIDNPQII